MNLFKGKGDRTECDSSRGLLISDHVGKAFINCLKEDLDDGYRANMPGCQFGAIKGGGTDFAHHIVLSALDYAAGMSFSIFVLFVDLVKAFDLVL